MKNETLVGLIRQYSMNSHAEYAAAVHALSKETLIATLTDLLTQYINDKNSSSIREFLTVETAGYRHQEAKIGYNGYRHVHAGKPIACEAKPQNIQSANPQKRKLNGGGNFTDYSWKRLAKDKREKPNMLISGFVDGKMLYLFEFPFCEKTFVKKLEARLKAKFPDGDRSGIYLRSASFDFNDYKDSRALKIHFINKKLIEEFKAHISGKFYLYLHSLPA